MSNTNKFNGLRSTTFAMVHGNGPSRRVALTGKDVYLVDFSQFMTAALAVGLPVQPPTVAGVPCNWQKIGNKVRLTPKVKAIHAKGCNVNGRKKYNRTDKDVYYY